MNKNNLKLVNSCFLILNKNNIYLENDNLRIK